MQGQLNTIVKESSSVDPNAKARRKEGIELQETSSLTWVEAIGHADKIRQGGGQNPRSQRHQTIIQRTKTPVR